MPLISFFQEDISFELLEKSLIINWVKQVIKGEGKQLGDINFIFCSDNYLHNINLSYLNHDTLTDIVTFDNSEVENEIEGDIFISIDRVRENAELFKRPEKEELHRVIIHGVLHLIGFSDKSDIEKKQMRKKEEACLSLRKL